MTALLPKERFEATLNDLVPGQGGWTVPWALSVGEDRQVYLRTAFTPRSSQFGTADMYVTRRSDGGWRVDISRSDFRFSAEEHPQGEPVAELIS